MKTDLLGFELLNNPSKSTFNRSQYMQKVHQYIRVCMKTQSEFLRANIEDNHHNPPKLWRVLGDVLYRLPAKSLPSINAPQLLADRFVDFFTDKIEKKFAYFSCLPELSTHHSGLYSPHVFHFLHCNG